MMTEINVRIMRLKTGEDIISYCEDLDDSILLHDPMTILFKRTSSGSMMMITPWLPFELLEQNSTEISYEDIVTIMEPKEEMINYYEYTLNSEAELFKEYSDIFLSKIRKFLSGEDGTEDIEQDLTETPEANNKVTKKHTLH